MYITLNDGTIGKIKQVCDCDACRERGDQEIEIVDFDGLYLCYKKTKGISKENLLYFGDSSKEAIDAYINYITKNTEMYNKLKNHIDVLIKEWNKKHREECMLDV